LKALALIGSPRKGGNTDCLADAFLEGAAEAGAEVEKIYLDDLNIRPIAEVCDDFSMRVDLRADDDWRKVMHKVIEADVLVWGAPGRRTGLGRPRLLAGRSGPDEVLC